MLRQGGLFSFHRAGDINTCHWRGGITAYGHHLFEVAPGFVFPIIGNADLARFPRHDFAFCIVCHGTTAGRHGLVDDERFVARVGKGKDGRLDILFHKFAKVEGCLLKV